MRGHSGIPDGDWAYYSGLVGSREDEQIARAIMNDHDQHSLDEEFVDIVSLLCISCFSALFGMFA